VNTSLQGNG